MSQENIITFAAIQMSAVLADVEKNLKKAEYLVREAAKEKAHWIVLPEFFTSACAFHPKMHEAILPIDGKATQLLKYLSEELNVVIGGSFLARHENNVFNTFTLVFPNGSIYMHNKDIPTMWENCYYIGDKEDDGVLETKTHSVGVALCWEMLRTQTAKRLLSKVKFILSGSCWWNLPDSAPKKFNPLRKESLSLLKATPVTFAKLLGVPVIHAGHAGDFVGLAPPSNEKPYSSHYMGETAIVDRSGSVLARMSREDGEGFITADIELANSSTPSMELSNNYWIPDMPKAFLAEWKKLNKFGEEYYQNEKHT